MNDIAKTILRVGKWVICKTGNHSGDFKNMPNKALCYFERECTKCKEITVEERHNFGEWIPQEKCIEERICIYCKKAKQTRITHRYIETYVDERCNVWGICEKCGDKRKMNEKTHQWEIVAKIDENGKREEIKKCLRCGDNGKMLGLF